MRMSDLVVDFRLWYDSGMSDIDVSPVEDKLLHEFLVSGFMLPRLKAMAILMICQGFPIEGVAAIVQRSVRTVQVWLTRWRQVRMASIFSGHIGNLNASYLSEEQRARVVQTLAKKPEEGGIDGEFWSVKGLADFVSYAFGVEYESDTSYHFLLRLGKLSFRYPATFDQRRSDDAVIEARMGQIREEVAELLKDPDTEVFTCDEVQIQLTSEVRKAWLPQGEKTVLKVDRENAKQSYIGFLNQRTFACEVYRMDWQNSIEVIKAFDRFLRDHPDKKIAVVWDNAGFHTSQMIRDQLGKGGILQRVHLIAMPPYAPDYNPIEHVWGNAKDAISNHQHRTIEHAMGAFETHIRSRTFEYQI